ncbi:MAG TPA: zinc ribbon domain-containing protein [Myxococcales bacterium]|nr:zinc ribbon domain-containing protein [Myxococcales bacterium]
MPISPFTRNYSDHSNNEGYQFEFFCDKCGNGYRSSWVANKGGIAADILGAASSLFGGFGGAAAASTRVKDMLRGPAWDAAYAAAIAECKPRFKKCSRCGKWVCPETCWNADREMCADCAPNLEREAAAAQAQAAVSQMQDKVAAVDQTGGLDAKAHHTAACPHCGAPVPGGKFCPECGKSLATSAACTKCGAQVALGAKFCPECGAPRV